MTTVVLRTGPHPDRRAACHNVDLKLSMLEVGVEALFFRLVAG